MKKVLARIYLLGQTNTRVLCGDQRQLGKVMATLLTKLILLNTLNIIFFLVFFLLKYMSAKLIKILIIMNMCFVTVFGRLIDLFLFFGKLTIARKL